jgi:hypothetical protein
MDLSPLSDAAVTLASAAFAALTPLVVIKLNAFLKLNLDQTHRDAVSSALETALGLGLQLAKEAGDSHLANVSVRSAAVGAMVGYVKQAVPEAIGHFGLSDEAIAQKASAKLATALHASSAVSQAVSAVTSLLPAATAVLASPAPAQPAALPASP